jgi:hypothetical protein
MRIFFSPVNTLFCTYILILAFSPSHYQTRDLFILTLYLSPSTLVPPFLMSNDFLIFILLH